MPRELTPRQRQVLLLKANGLTSAQIATQLGRATDTVNGVLGRIYQVLGVHNDTQAVAVALALGELGIHEIHIPDEQWEDAA